MPDIMETGLSLRAAVAVEVMQWAWNPESCFFRNPEKPNGNWAIGALPPWERDRTAAQQVIERIEEMGLTFKFVTLIDSDWAANRRDAGDDYYVQWHTQRWYFLKLSAEQICQAALSVIRESRKGRGG